MEEETNKIIIMESEGFDHDSDNDDDYYDPVQEEIDSDNYFNYMYDLNIDIKTYCQDNFLPVGEKLTVTDLFDLIATLES